MKFVFLSKVVTLTLISCGDRPRFAIVEEYNEMFLKDSNYYAPYDYYVGNNILIPESSNELYYHNKELFCGTGWSVNRPPDTVNFESRPLWKFRSVPEIWTFLKDHGRSHGMVIIGTDHDTITNPLYFELMDSINTIRKIIVIARRIMTQDEIAALRDSLFYSVDMAISCELNELVMIQNLLKSTNVLIDNEPIKKFIELSRKQCLYAFEYAVLYENVLYQLINANPLGFATECEKIEEEVRLGIALALKNASLVEDSVVAQAYSSIHSLNSRSTSWILEAMEEQLYCSQ